MLLRVKGTSEKDVGKIHDANSHLQHAPQMGHGLMNVEHLKLHVEVSTHKRTQGRRIVLPASLGREPSRIRIREKTGNSS